VNLACSNLQGPGALMEHDNLRLMIQEKPGSIGYVGCPRVTTDNPMLRCHAMAPPEARLPEARDRQCPVCYSEEIVPVGHVSGRMIKVEPAGRPLR
jgi:hypothetical protein